MASSIPLRSSGCSPVIRVIRGCEREAVRSSWPDSESVKPADPSSNFVHPARNVCNNSLSLSLSRLLQSNPVPSPPFVRTFIRTEFISIEISPVAFQIIKPRKQVALSHCVHALVAFAHQTCVKLIFAIRLEQSKSIGCFPTEERIDFEWRDYWFRGRVKRFEIRKLHYTFTTRFVRFASLLSSLFQCSYDDHTLVRTWNTVF